MIRFGCSIPRLVSCRMYSPKYSKEERSGDESLIFFFSPKSKKSQTRRIILVSVTQLGAPVTRDSGSTFDFGAIRETEDSFDADAIDDRLNRKTAAFFFF